MSINIKRMHAWRILGYLDPWKESTDWAGDAYQELRSQLEADRGREE